MGREVCWTCRRAKAVCYCARIKPFEAGIRFVILIHKEETRKSIATGRMAHLCLKNSLLFEGTDFTEHEGVNRIIDEGNAVVLYPGEASLDVTEGIALPPPATVFLFDGTWSQARRMRRLSRNLARLPAIRFTPPDRSRFHVRKQPWEHCYSTIEAIHWLLEKNRPDDRHASLLEVFDYMVSLQLWLEPEWKRRLRPLAPYPASDPRLAGA
jgi:DTW domain-containing protein